MKFYSLLILSLFFLYNCEKDKNDNAKDNENNELPEATINTPIPPDGNECFVEGTNIEIQGHAYDADGTIVKAEYYANDKIIAKFDNEPFFYEWENPPVGNYLISLVAYDDAGAKGASIPQRLKIIPKTKPYIALIKPKDNSNFIQGDNLEIYAEAIDYSSEISKVDFYADDVYIGTESEYSYNFYWENIPVGEHNVHAVAYDDENNSAASDKIYINVEPHNAPVLSLSSPWHRNYVFSHTLFYDITLSVNDPDANNHLDSIIVYCNDSIIGYFSSVLSNMDFSGYPSGDYHFKVGGYNCYNAYGESNIFTLRVFKSIEYGSKIDDIKIVPDRNIAFAICSDNNSLIKMDLINQEIIAEYSTPFPYPIKIGILPSQNQLIILYEEGGFSIWDIEQNDFPKNITSSVSTESYTHYASEEDNLYFILGSSGLYIYEIGNFTLLNHIDSITGSQIRYDYLNDLVFVNEDEEQQLYRYKLNNGTLTLEEAKYLYLNREYFDLSKDFLKISLSNNSELLEYNAQNFNDIVGEWNCNLKIPKYSNNSNHIILFDYYDASLMIKNVDNYEKIAELEFTNTMSYDSFVSDSKSNGNYLLIITESYKLDDSYFICFIHDYMNLN